MSIKSLLKTTVVALMAVTGGSLFAQGTPIEVLATADSKIKNATFPQVFIVKHPKTKIAAITLGHDARAHDLQAYKTLLINAVNWTKQR